MDTLLQEMLGGVRRLQENVGVTLFLKDRDKKIKYKLHLAAAIYFRGSNRVGGGRRAYLCRRVQETRCLFKAYHFGSRAKLAIYW